MNRIVKVLAVTAVALSATTDAFAQTQWQKDHPRRAEVNHRLANQNKRIHNEVKEGEMSKGQAARLHKEDRQIRQEERDMASQNGGHITKQEQRTLNQQENKVSRQIGN
jgi:CRISPR/Cas system-associated endoribonuclease Cas2